MGLAFGESIVLPFRTGVVVAADAATTASRPSRGIVRGDALCPRWTKMALCSGRTKMFVAGGFS